MDCTIIGEAVGNSSKRTLSIHRSGFYYTGVGASELNLDLMKVIDEHFLKYPFKGSRRMAVWLNEQGYKVNRKRIQRLCQLMGLRTIYPKPDLSKSDPVAYKYPYLLKALKMERNNQVRAIDITDGSRMDMPDCQRSHISSWETWYYQ